VRAREIERGDSRFVGFELYWFEQSIVGIRAVFNPQYERDSSGLSHGRGRGSLAVVRHGGRRQRRR